MRGIEGEQVLMRIFLGRPAGTDRRPLYRQILDLLRSEGLAGGTVLKGVAGFGHGRHVHTASIEALSDDLPLVVEVVDTEEHLQRLLPNLETVMVGGAVMLERAHVIRYGGDGRPPGS